jgi:hypothetical protein
VFIHDTLMFVDGVHDLRPEIPTDLIMAVDALVQPFNCEIGCPVPRCSIRFRAASSTLADIADYSPTSQF